MTKFSVPLYAYKQFMDWASLCKETHYEYNPKSTFRSVMKKINDHKSFAHQITRNIDAMVDSSPKVTIQSFPFLMNVQNLLKNNDIMENSIWRCDPSSADYNELNTGQWWANAELNIINQIHQSGIQNTESHYLCTVILFIDGTHCDRNGRLNAEPVLCSIGNICLSQRNNSKSWFF